MNELRLYTVIRDRYQTQYSGLLHKLLHPLINQGTGCSYNTSLASTLDVTHTMQKSLKLKLQNVLNQVNQADAESPALIVGGRRRNRKKRRHRNGQAARRRNRRGGGDETPHVASPTKIPEEKPSCLDIEEPVFERPTASLNPDRKYVINYDPRDSVYNSNESLASVTSSTPSTSNEDNLKTSTPIESEAEYDVSNCLEEVAQECLIENKVDDVDDVDDDGDVDEDDVSGDEDIELPLETGPYDNNIEKEIKIAKLRLHNQDSGIFDDVDFDDGQTNEQVDVASSVIDAHKDTEDKEDHLIEVNVDEQGNHANERRDDIIQNEAVVVPSLEENQHDSEHEYEDEKPIIDTASEEDLQKDDPLLDDFNAAAILQIEQDLGVNLKPEEEELQLMEKAQNNLEDGKILLDLSDPMVKDEPDTEMEINQLTFAGVTTATSVEVRDPLQIDLDDIESDDDVIIFEASKREDRDVVEMKDELTITCNPLYEQTIKREAEEGEEVSIKRYQSGYGPGFDEHNIITIPVPSTSPKKYKESSPLITNRKLEGNKNDEIACCVIL